MVSADHAYFWAREQPLWRLRWLVRRLRAGEVRAGVEQALKERAKECRG